MRSAHHSVRQTRKMSPPDDIDDVHRPRLTSRFGLTPDALRPPTEKRAMRKRKTEAEKKKPGPKPHRTFYNRIGFQVSESFHIVINNIAQERKVRFEDIYAEAVQYFLNERTKNSILYTPSPIRRFAQRVTIHMEPSLEKAVRAACLQDQQRLTDFFQTTVWLYLKHLDQLPEKISAALGQL